MNNNEPAAERYSINGFKYFSELAKEYFPDLANASSASKKMRIRPKKFTMCVKARAEAMLVQLNYSPEQIVGRCKGLGFPMVSVERLYQWIWEDKRKGGDLYRSLRRKGRKHGKRGSAHNSRGCIPNRKDISERPAIVEKKTMGRFGNGYYYWKE